MKLEEYLISKHTISTASHYLYDINSFLEHYPNRNAKSASYTDLLEYIKILRRKYENPATVKTKLMAVKKYYEWLCSIGTRNDNPAASIILKDARPRNIQAQDLFSPEELMLIFNRRERYRILKNRNQIILSLLIFQGLKTSEITRLIPDDINWEEKTILIRETSKTHGRELKLRDDQINSLRQYVDIDREILLDHVKSKKKVKGNNFLILNKIGETESGEGIAYLVSTCKNLFPGKKLNPITIRQSVVVNLLKKGIDLRIVQAYAGHMYIGTTLKYRQSNIEQLKIAVNQFHPIQFT